MKAYMIIATVNDIDYLTKVEAESLSGAEHAVLDLSVCGRHTYGVTACMAFGMDELKTDTFIGSVIRSNPVSFDDLKEIIEKRNAEILEKDAAEESIRVIEKQIEALKKQLEKEKAIIAK